MSESLQDRSASWRGIQEVACDRFAPGAIRKEVTARKRQVEAGTLASPTKAETLPARWLAMEGRLIGERLLKTYRARVCPEGADVGFLGHRFERRTAQ